MGRSSRRPHRHLPHHRNHRWPAKGHRCYQGVAYMSKATSALLEDLHGALAEEMLARVRSGEATAAELAAVAKFLKDNSVTAVIEDNSAMDELRSQLARRRAKAPAAIPGYATGALSTEEADDIVGGLH
ncbi:terminase small subunit [Ralstonia phage RSJ2]|uniref:Putative DNA maturase A n=1 Tax=Ralstonia phage RSJ2 TaxID=1481785 RepID=A0A068Q6Z3_9CAUD|nr:terminase small subunit [Ralstonia phage RSJ2]BAP15845.1 putative DNA maturase A [Ralstonia phage RSJ2]